MSMSNIVIAVDSGKYATKSVRRLTKSEFEALKKDKTAEELKNIKDYKTLAFRTKMDDTDETTTQDRASCVVEFEGERYILGNSAENVDYDMNKAKKVHKLAVYAAICQLLQESETEVSLAIGCPISSYVNVENRLAYKEFFSNPSKINITINGVERNFTIKNVIICPESSGIIYKNHKKYKKKQVGVIDIGGLNTNCCVYDNLVAVDTTRFTSNLGANILSNELKLKLNSRFGTNLQDYQMENVIQQGHIKSHKEESEKFIAEFFEGHFQQILKECKKKGWDLANIDLVFSGGGSILLEQQIKNNTIEGTEISGDAQWDNVVGFLTVGEMTK